MTKKHAYFLKTQTQNNEKVKSKKYYSHSRLTT
jgi:hypothetical protein